MTTAPGFGVDPGALLVHADHVAGVDRAIDRVLSGAAPLSPDSYGVIGQVFAVPVILAIDDAAGALHLLRNDLTTKAAALRECADGYITADRSAAGTIGGTR
ncbi:type VII secretion target [Pseudonocardia sp. T1-2H]|uniref:type VII secretion target n=1 Tax=Pseudonocardia sp. T1-2H TaxID=3128899 RepID=UPI0031010D36